jgi:hypothetical protein
VISLAFEPLARLYNRPARNSRRLMPVPKLSQRMLPAGPPSMEGAESVTIALHGSMTADVSVGSQDSDVPSQALNARLIALLLPCWLEGLGDGSCRGEGGT